MLGLQQGTLMNNIGKYSWFYILAEVFSFRAQFKALVSGFRLWGLVRRLEDPQTLLGFRV